MVILHGIRVGARLRRSDNARTPAAVPAPSAREVKTVALSPASNRKGRPRSGAKAFTTRLTKWWLDPARNWPDDQRPLV